jgi:hypothetical protein
MGARVSAAETLEGHPSDALCLLVLVLLLLAFANLGCEALYRGDGQRLRGLVAREGNRNANEQGAHADESEQRATILHGILP